LTKKGGTSERKGNRRVDKGKSMFSLSSAVKKRGRKKGSKRPRREKTKRKKKVAETKNTLSSIRSGKSHGIWGSAVLGRLRGCGLKRSGPSPAGKI